MGKLITIEGIDGSGKGSQVKNIKNYLNEKGIKNKIFSFPIYKSLTGNIISDHLTGKYGDITDIDYKQVCLFYAANRFMVKDKIEKAIEENELIISDRYTYSNLFSISKNPKNKWDESIKWLEDLEFGEFKLPKPYHNIYLYIDPEFSIKRTTERGKRDYQNGKADIYETNIDLLKSATECYSYISSCRDNWTIINQMKNGDNGLEQLDQNTVFELIKSCLELIINEK